MPVSVCGLDKTPPHSHCPKTHCGPPGGPSGTKRLAWILAITCTYMILEALGGYYSGSLSLLADAAHMLSDSLMLVLSLLAGWLAHRPAGPRYSFGYQRVEILAALVSGSVLIGLSGGILLYAGQRFHHSHLPSTGMMMLVATGGLCVNAIGLVLLHASRRSSLNLRAAWLHLLTDFLGSLAVLASGAVVSVTQWHWVDPFASMILALLVGGYALLLVREAVDVLMEAAPKHVSPQTISQHFLAQDQVVAVHHVHVWSINWGVCALSAHVVFQQPCDQQKLLAQLHALAKERFGIAHVTVQVEAQTPAPK